jgi:hypothetical protein
MGEGRREGVHCEVMQNLSALIPHPEVSSEFVWEGVTFSEKSQ